MTAARSKPVVLGGRWEPPGSRIIWWSRKPAFAAMGRIGLRDGLTGVGAQPRSAAASFEGPRTRETRLRAVAGSESRRAMRPIGTLSRVCTNRMIRKSGALKTVSQDGFWPVESGARSKRPEGRRDVARRGDPRDQTTGFGPWNREPGRSADGIPRLTLQGEWSSVSQGAK